MMTYNSQERWDTLLSDKDYLLDLNNSVSARVRSVSSFIKKKKFESLINIGSGQGYLESFLADILEKINWVSLDISILGLKNLSEFNVNRVLGYAHNLPFKSSSYDCCVSMEVIEHIPKRRVSLVYSEFRRILKKRGYLVVTVPVFEPTTLIDHPVGHLRKFVPGEIILELEAAGFSILSTRKFFAFNSLYYVKSMIAKIFFLRRPSVYLLFCRKR